MSTAILSTTPSTVGYDVEALRAAEFPWAARGEAVYLNNASTGPLPARSVTAIGEWVQRRAEPFRLRDPELVATLARARALCATLIGAEAPEIALMTNTSYGINVAARVLPLQPGDVVLTFAGEFPANVYPWMALAERGVRLEMVPLRDGLPDEEALLRALARPEVKALTVSWVQFASGYRVDLARLGQRCRELGVWFVVDAIQGVGPCTLDVRTLPIDLLACGAQKWLLSPWGSGFLYVRRELIAQLVPNAVGWLAFSASDDFSRLTDYDDTLRDDARRFEVATIPYQDVAGLVASLELLLELGPAHVAAHVRALGDRIVAWAQARDDVRLVTPADPERRAGIVSVAPHDLAGAAARLREAGIVHSVREGAVRLSPHGYNTAGEVARALDALGG